jgi:hypothetical protein
MGLLHCRLALSSSLCVAASPPNIIIHFISDLGYGGIGPFGAVKQKTPYFDTAAQKEIGKRFADKFIQMTQ